MAQRVLFICGRNRCRSPTAEVVARDEFGVEADSAGVRKDADVVVDVMQVEWADLIVVMERRYLKPLQSLCGPHLRQKRVVSMDIPDDYEAMDPALVDLLRQRLPRFLRA